jgi:MSHA biogenesis protein MshP
MCPECRLTASRVQSGFALVTGIFLLVVLAALGAFMLFVSGLMTSAGTLDVQGSRAYQAARAGVEWGAYQALRAPPCAGATLTFPGTALAPFTTSVTCAATLASEGGASVTVTEITATACDAPPCPNPAPGANYVERRLTVIVSR